MYEMLLNVVRSGSSGVSRYARCARGRSRFGSLSSTVAILRHQSRCGVRPTFLPWRGVNRFLALSAHGTYMVPPIRRARYPGGLGRGGSFTGCPLIPTQALWAPRWGTTRGVWSTGARSPRALGGTCDGHDLSVAPGRPPGSWPSPSPSVAHHHQVVDRRLPALRPSERAQHRRRSPFGRGGARRAPRAVPFGRRRRQSVPADGADTPAMKSSFPITASSRSSSSAIFSPTRRQRPATPRRW